MQANLLIVVSSKYLFFFYYYYLSCILQLLRSHSSSALDCFFLPQCANLWLSVSVKAKLQLVMSSPRLIDWGYESRAVVFSQ